MSPSIRIVFEFEGTAEGTDKAVALLKAADKLGVDAAPASPPPAAAKGPAPAKAPAPAKGKAPAPAAAKANSKAKPKEPEPDIMDFTGGDDEEEEETGGLGLGDDDPMQEFEGTAEDAKEEALAILRTMLGNGLKPQVKEVQQIMKVAKFHDVPAEQGYEFLAAVKKVEAKIAKN